MTSLREAAQQALEAMEDAMYRADTHEFYDAKESLRTALAEPVQPVADRDTVIRLAREVGLWEMLEGYSSEYGSLNAEDDCLGELQRFAALVAAHEREECAKVFDNAPKLVPFGKGKDGGCIMCGFNSEKAAAAIRSRT